MRRRILTLAALAAGAALASGPARAAEDIVIGLSTVLSGPVASVGEQGRSGAEAAVAALNAQGGVLGRKLRLDVADDACDPKQAVSVANRFATRGIGLVLGPLCSSSAIAASSVLAEEGAVMMTASATNPTLTERGLARVFRACGRDDQQGVVAAAMLADKFAGKRIAVVHDKSSYGQGIADVVAATLRARKVPIAFTGSVNAGEKDFTALVSRLKQEGIDAIYYGGYHSELGLIVRQARGQGLGAVFVGPEGLGTSEYWAIAGEAAAGTLFTNAPDVNNDPVAAEAKRLIISRGNPTPDNFAYYYYAAVTVLADAIKAANSTAPQAVAKALRDGSFNTIVGPIAFDAKGDLRAPAYEIFEWRNGTYKAVGK